MSISTPCTSAGSPTTGNGFLISYFRSGWAFLIPYLNMYLLYAWLRWPVNPTDAGRTEFSWIPALLHVYWGLHAVHLLLAASALAGWWRNRNVSTSLPEAAWPHLSAVFPWLCLGLLFFLPGIYLEFPADPWTHYARVNEWSALNVVSQHSAWAKSSYFLAYSFIGRIAPPLLQLRWFDAYYTACCLLLCWQYYRLARTVGLGERASFIFVLLQAFILGNSIFGFYRYYGMSSTLFAQLGATALIRAALEAVQPGTRRGGSFHRRLFPLLASGFLLLALTAFNHLQGLGLAGIGISAVVIWRLIEWRRSMRWWLAGAAVILSLVAIHWFPRHPALDETYRPQGWLTAWYGFNLFSPGSPAFGRSAAIIGFTGLANLLAGLYLLRRNHIVAWLSLLPILLLCLPIVTIPLINQLDKADRSNDLVVYHRLLLAIPAGLAAVTLGSALVGRSEHRIGIRQVINVPALLSKPAIPLFRFPAPFLMLLTCVGALVAIPVAGPYYNRLYNILVIPSNDLAMHDTLRVVTALKTVDESRHRSAKGTSLPNTPGAVAAPRGMGYVVSATGRPQVVEPSRLIGSEPWNVPATRSERLLWLAGSSFASRSELVVIQPRPFELSTPFSISGYLSQHWRPQEVALEYTAAAELSAMASAAQIKCTGTIFLPGKPAGAPPASAK